MSRSSFKDGWLMILGTSFCLGLVQLLGNLVFTIICVLLMIGGVFMIYFDKKSKANFKISKEIKEYFSKYAIISISTALIGIFIFYTFTPAIMSYSPLSNTGIYFAIPFLLIAVISGVIGVSAGTFPVIELIGAILGFIWFFMSLTPLIMYLLSFAAIFFV